MKKFVIVATLLSLAFAMPTYAQSSKQELKEKKELIKQKRKLLDEKVSKQARNNAKEMKKNGWNVIPGKLSLEKQLDRSYLMQEETDDYGYEKFIMGTASSIGENYDAAKFQALELAKLDIATKMESEMVALTDATVANKQLQPEEAASIVNSVTAAKSKIAQSFGRVITVIEVYRDLKNKNKEVSVTIAYNHELALQTAKKVIKEELEKSGDNLHQKLDNITGW